MYGLVNKGIENLIYNRYGEKVWEEIKEKANLEREGFISMHFYEDADTYKLVMAASEVLKRSAEEILEEFGTHWVVYTVDKGYGEMLNMAGNTFIEFVKNLDELHTRVGLLMPNLSPPSFSVNKLEDGKFSIRYYSSREGLASMVIGLLKGLAMRFQEEISIDHISKKQENKEYDEFIVAVQG